MATGGHYTFETEYFCRYFRLVNETGPKVLRHVLTFVAGQNGVKPFLGNNMQRIKSLLTKKILRKAQYDLIFPAAPLQFSLEDWDVTLLCAVINEICPVPPAEEGAIDSIRKARNELNHKPKPTMPKQDFQTKWLNISTNYRVLLVFCQDNNFQIEIMDEVDIIEKSPLSIAPVLDLYHKFENSAWDTKEEIREFQHDMNTLKDKLETLKNAVQTISEEMVRQTHIYSKVIKTVQNVHESIRILHDQTRSMLAKTIPFVHTEQLLIAERVLEQRGCVIISGGAGEGKTATALEIMRRQSENKRCIQILSADDIHRIEPNQFDIVFIDDIFGIHEMDESKLKSWVTVLEKLNNLVNAKAFKIIIAAREYVLKECCRDLRMSRLFVPENKVLLKSENLSFCEKEQILREALSQNKKIVDDLTVRRYIKAFSAGFGFPYICMLFASNEEFYKMGEAFFQQHNSICHDIISNLNPSKRIALMFVWIVGSSVTFIRSEKNDVLLSKLCSRMKYNIEIEDIYREVYEQLQNMDGVFVMKTELGYGFMHNSIYEATGYYIARAQLIEIVIEHSSLDFFMACICLEEENYRPDRAYIRKEHFPFLIERVIIEVTKRYSGETIAMHSCFNVKLFVEHLLKELKDRKQLKQFLMSPSSNGNQNVPKEDLSFISLFLERRSQHSCCFLEQLMNVFPRGHIFNFGASKSIIYQQAFYGACKGGNMEALELLKFVDIEGKFLLAAVSSKNVDLFKQIAERLNVRQHEQLGQKPLHMAVENGDLSMYCTVRKYAFCKLDIECLLIANRIKHKKLLVRILKDMGKRNASQYISKDKLAEVVRSIFSIEVFDALNNAGFSVTKHDIHAAIKNDIKSIESVLWHLKYPISVQGEKTISRRQQMWKQLTRDSRIKAELETFGILNTREFLLLNAKKGNTDIVIDIITKEIEVCAWITKGEFPTTLLIESLPHPDLCKHLLQLGIKPSVRTLLHAILCRKKNTKTVELIISKLKDINIFNPSDDTIRQCFKMSIYDFDTYDLFLREGMEPTADHFLYVSQRYSQTDSTVSLAVFNKMFSSISSVKDLHQETMSAALLNVLDDEAILSCFEKHNIYGLQIGLVELSMQGDLQKIKILIEYWKKHGQWPSSEIIIKQTLKFAFYKEDLFNNLMAYVNQTPNADHIWPFNLLFTLRTGDHLRLDSLISSLDESQTWDDNCIVLKVAYLENVKDQHVCALFESKGITIDEVLDHEDALQNTELNAYIMATLEINDLEIDFSNLDEDLIRAMMNYENLCCYELLKRAVEVSEFDDVKQIWHHFKNQNQTFTQTEEAKSFLFSCSDIPNLYTFLLEEGLHPNLQCLLAVVTTGSVKVFEKSVKQIDGGIEICDFAYQVLRQILLKKDITFYTLFKQFSREEIKPRLCDILFALKVNSSIDVNFFIDDLEIRQEEELEILDLLNFGGNVFDKIIRMYTNTFSVSSNLVFCAVKKYLHGCILSKQLKEVISFYFTDHEWQLEDDNFMKIEEVVNNNQTLDLLLSSHILEAKSTKIYKVLISKEDSNIENIFKVYENDISLILKLALRRAVVSRKRLKLSCLQDINRFTATMNIDPSIQILIYVLLKDLQNLNYFIGSLSLHEKSNLDDTITQTSLEAAMAMNATDLFFCVCESCVVKPTTYCLLHGLYNNNEKCVAWIIQHLPESSTTTKDTYFKASVSLCCKNNDFDQFLNLIKESQLTDTELFYDAVVSRNERMCSILKRKLQQSGRWIKSDYWILSAEELCISENLITIRQTISFETNTNIYSGLTLDSDSGQGTIYEEVEQSDSEIKGKKKKKKRRKIKK